MDDIIIDIPREREQLNVRKSNEQKVMKLIEDCEKESGYIMRKSFDPTRYVIYIGNLVIGNLTVWATKRIIEELRKMRK